MPDEPVPTPEPPPPEQPTLIGGLSPDEMFARGMQSVKMTSGTQGTWQPPGVEEANRLFPNYNVLGLLGRGGMGAVYKANQTSLDRLVAIKLLPLEVSVDKDFADRFVREARAMAKLNHPNIISVHDFGKTSEGHLYFVMEYVEGANLADLIHRVGLTSEQSLAIVEQVCTALAYAHAKGIVHRDIKPANVMIDTESQVKVADFGLARLTDPSAEQYGHTMTGTVMGTPDYMAPEQMKGMNVDHRADIYSLGVMVYEMLCREVPRGAFEPPSVHAGCDPRIDPIVIKAMQPNPDRRYQSTQEMKADVSAVRTPLPVAPPPPHSVAALLPKPPKIPAKPTAPPTPETAVMQAISPPSPAKSKTPLYAGIAAIAVVIAAAAFFLFKPKSEPPANARINARDTTGGTRSVVPQTSVGEGGGKVGADRAAPSTATKDAPFVNTLGMKFVPVPITGGPTAGQQVLFSVWDTRVQDYATYAAANPNIPDNWRTQGNDGVPCGREPDHPVVGVSWLDAQEFCQWLTAKEQSEGKLPKGMSYRLPTDEEWSWAVGLPPESGTAPAEKDRKNNEDFPWGKDYPPAKKVGNYGEESFHAKFPPRKNEKDGEMENQTWIKGYDDGYATTSPVGAFPANAYGLYDMGGNVWQWCEDWFDASHKEHVLRGASWYSLGHDDLLSSARNRHAPTFHSPHYGFRCVLAPVRAGVGAASLVSPSIPSATAGRHDWMAAKRASRNFIKNPNLVDDGQQVRLLSSQEFEWSEAGTFRNGVVRVTWTVPLDRESTQEAYLQFRRTGLSAGRQNYQAVFQPKNRAIKFQRLENTVAGTKGYVLKTWPLPQGFDPAAECTLAVRAQEDRFTVLLNDQEIGTVQDSTIPGAGFTSFGAPDGTLVRKFEFQSLDAPATAEPWVNALRDKGQLALDKVEVLPEGVRFNGIASLQFRQGPRRDGAVRVRAVFDEAVQSISLRARSKDGGKTFYNLGFANSTELSLQRFDGIAKQTFKIAQFPLSQPPATGQDYELELRVVGTKLTAKFNGTVVGEADDANLSEGYWGVRNYPAQTVLAKAVDYLDLSAASPPAVATVSTATKDAPFVNTLGMKFVPVPGTKVLFSIWDTRVQDYAAYAAARTVDDAWAKQQKDGVPVGRELNHPVVGVNWDDAQAFCQWLTEKEQAEGKLPKGMKYRLPMDEEWSWAADLPSELGTTPGEKSAKNSADFPWGKDYPPKDKTGNYPDESFHAKFPSIKNEKENRMENQWMEGYTDGYATTSPVGAFPANASGLYDMGGNVWQWCEDWFDASHKERVQRGASWGTANRGALLSSYRSHLAPTYHSYFNGFRCVLAPAAADASAVTSNIPAGGEPWQDLLAGIKLPEDVRDNATYQPDRPGHWELREGALWLTSGRGSVVVTPATGAANYDVKFKLKRSTRAYNASVGLPVGDHKVLWETLSKAPCGFERIGATDIRDGPASAPNPFEDGQPHDVLLSVRTLANGEVSLRSTIDGQPSAEWTGPASQLGVHVSWSHQPKDRLCLGASGAGGGTLAEVVFSEVRFRPVQADTASPSSGLQVPSFPVLAAATKDAPFENTLGMKFVPVPILDGPTVGQRVLFSVWDTRVRDYEVFAKETKREWPKPDFEQGPTHPAVNVSWDDATAFCAWLTKREHQAGKLGANEVYRLPSDYEWSCAVGLGAAEEPADLPANKTGKNSDLFPWGVQWPPPEKTGNYASEELKPLLAAGKYPFIKDVISGYHDGYANTSPVGSYGANRFGLFDMSGNVQQWCEDWFDKDRKDRVLRGASWTNNSRGSLLSSFRHHYVPTIRNLFFTSYGFRCVLAPVSAVAPSSSPSAAGQWIDLLPLVDIKRDEVQGTWSKKPAGLSLDSAFKFGMCELPYEPPEEYDFAVEFTPTSNGNNVNLHLRAGGASFLWKLNAHSRTPPIYGLDLLDGKFMPNRTEAVVTYPLRLEIGQHYTTQVEVRRGGLRALVNGNEVFQWSGDYKRLSTESGAQLRHPEALAIGSFGRTVIFQKAEVREITGTGKITAESASAATPAP